MSNYVHLQHYANKKKKRKTSVGTDQQFLSIVKDGKNLK